MRRDMIVEITDDEADSFDGLDETYRRGSLTVGSNYMQIDGVDYNMLVMHADLQFGRQIGKGACSTVKIAHHRKTGENYAVKMFNIYDENQSRQLQVEICMLSNLKCDSVIGLKGAFHDGGSIGIIMEHMDRGSLEFILNDYFAVSQAALAGIIYQILWGLGYLHHDNRLHRDIKPGNILINSKGEVKLSDFGTSRSMDNSAALSNTFVGTFLYMSPERLLGEMYNSSSDLWSVGVMMIQLWSKKYPFENIKSPIDLLSVIEDLKLDSYLAKFPKTMSTIIRSTLASSPTNRKSCVELLKSPWFQECSVYNISHAQQNVSTWLNDLEAKAQSKEHHFLKSSSKNYLLEQKISVDFASFKQECSIAMSPPLETVPPIYDNPPRCDEKTVQLYDRESISVHMNHSIKSVDQRIIQKLVISH